MPVLARQGCFLQGPVSRDKRWGVLICGVPSPSAFPFHPFTSNVRISQSWQKDSYFFSVWAPLKPASPAIHTRARVCVCVWLYPQHCSKNLEFGNKYGFSQYQDNDCAFSITPFFWTHLLNQNSDFYLRAVLERMAAGAVLSTLRNRSDQAHSMVSYRCSHK